MCRVLIIINRKFDKKKIDRSLGKNISRQPESTGGRTSGGYTSIDECKLTLRIPLRQKIHEHRSVAIHFGDGTTHEGNSSLPFVFDRDSRVIKRSAQGNILLFESIKIQKAEYQNS